MNLSNLDPIVSNSMMIQIPTKMRSPLRRILWSMLLLWYFYTSRRFPIFCWKTTNPKSTQRKLPVVQLRWLKTERLYLLPKQKSLNREEVVNPKTMMGLIEEQTSVAITRMKKNEKSVKKKKKKKAKKLASQNEKGNDKASPTSSPNSIDPAFESDS